MLVVGSRFATIMAIRHDSDSVDVKYTSLSNHPVGENHENVAIEYNNTSKLSTICRIQYLVQMLVYGVKGAARDDVEFQYLSLTH